MRFLSPLLSLLVVGSTYGQACPEVVWSPVPTIGPTARTEQVMAFDPLRGEAVLFGGFDGAVGLSDTWTWDGAQWTQEVVAAPPPIRWESSCAFDGAEVVLFGGCSPGGVLLGDTWQWNGVTWTNAGVSGPGARCGATMAYDSSRQEVILFGGLGLSGTISSQTWIWNGGAWSQAAPSASPPPRWQHTMAYDAGRGRVVLFGGQNSSGDLGDTWEWDGATASWSQVSTGLPSDPSPRFDASGVYDPSLGCVVLFGGQDQVGAAPVNDTWAWNGAQWTKLIAMTPPPLASLATDGVMVHDSIRTQNVGHFGSETWLLSAPTCVPAVGAGGLAVMIASLFGVALRKLSGRRRLNPIP